MPPLRELIERMGHSIIRISVTSEHDLLHLGHHAELDR
jgi:hypothetical protein